MTEIRGMEPGNGEFLVPFTQYVLPNGRKRDISFVASKEVHEKAQKILAAGYKFEIEILTTGEVSATIMDPVGEVDADIVISENNQDCPRKVSAMIMRFNPIPKSQREESHG